MSAQFRDLQMKSYEKLHIIYISRSKMTQHNVLKILVGTNNFTNFDEFQEKNFFPRDKEMPAQL